MKKLRFRKLSDLYKVIHLVRGTQVCSRSDALPVSSPRNSFFLLPVLVTP